MSYHFMSGPAVPAAERVAHLLYFLFPLSLVCVRGILADPYGEV